MLAMQASHSSQTFCFVNVSKNKLATVREVVRTNVLEQDPLNPKIDGGLCLQPPSSTSRHGVFIV